METITPMTTTVHRNVDGLTLPASLPPNVPPMSAPTAITNATDQTTLPEKTKKIAAATLTLNATACFKALRRVSVSSRVNPNADRTITLKPAPKYPP